MKEKIPTSLRRLGPSDLSGAAQVAKESGFHAYDGSSLEVALRTPRQTLLGVVDLSAAPEEGLLGAALIEVIPPEAELHFIAISSAVRRRGLGQKLLRICEIEAQAQGANQLFLEVAKTTNPAARALYASQGYYEVGTRPRYYADGDDAVMCRKDLAAKTPKADLVLLAGGQGARLGGCLKAGLRVEHETLLSKAVRTLPGETVWIVAPSALHPKLQAAMASHAEMTRPLWWVSDKRRGPAEALLEAAQLSQASHLLVAGVDYVAPSSSLLRRLLGYSVAGEGAWVRNAHGYPEFLMSVVESTPFRAAATALQNSEHTLSMRAVYENLVGVELSPSELSSEERRGLLDVDTPEDQAQLGVR